MKDKKNKKIKFSLNDVFHLARLARLKLTDKEAEEYRSQLEETLNYVKNLNELNTNNLKEAFYLNLKNVFFEDGKKNERAIDLKELKRKNEANKKYFSVKRIL